MKLKPLEFVVLSTLACFGMLSLINPAVVVRDRVVFIPAPAAPGPDPEPEEEHQ